MMDASGQRSSMESGLVSVIVPTFNAGALLDQAIDSLLAQSYTPLEIIVVDDGSTDGSADALAARLGDRITLLRQPNRGKPAALNHALSVARGEFYALQDADDYSHPERIARQVAALQRRPETAGVFCGYQLVLDGHTLAPHFRSKDEARCRADIEAFRMPGHDPTALYRRAVVGGLEYNEALPVVEGYDYVLRVGEQWPLHVLGACLYAYRVHNDTVTKRDPERRTRLLQVAKEEAAARRGTPLPETARRPLSGRRLRDNDLMSIFMESVADLRYAGRRWEALQCGLQCAACCPYELHYYRPLLAGLAPLRLYEWARPVRRPLIEPGAHQRLFA